MNDAIYKLIREHYKSLEGYVSAGMEAGKNEDIIYLNANENPYPLPGLEGLNRYPEPQPLALLEAYAQNYGVENDQIIMTRGADEAISLLTKVFCNPYKDKVLTAPPTFGMYSVDAYAMPAGVVEVSLIKGNGDFCLDKVGIIKAASDPVNHIKLVFLCSPNNPTGTSFPHDDIADIVGELEGLAMVVLDETYAEFSKYGSMSEDLAGSPNLIILRTLSKSYSMAGMRMGCLINEDSDFISLVRDKVMDIYPLPRLSIETAFHALSPEIKEIAHGNIAKILVQRERMKAALELSPHITHIYPSDANFLLVEMKDAKGFCDFAAHNNVIIRDFSSKNLTENCLRLSIGTPDENDLVLGLLARF